MIFPTMRLTKLLLFIFLSTHCSSQSVAKLIVPVGQAQVLNCYFSPNDQYLVSIDVDHALCIWDGNDGRQIFRFRDSLSSFSKVSFNSTSTLVAALSDSTLYLIDFLKLTIRKRFTRVIDYSFSPDGSTLFFIEAGRTLVSFTETGQQRSLSNVSKNNFSKIIGVSSVAALLQDGQREISMVDFRMNIKTPIKKSLDEQLKLLDYDLYRHQILIGIIARPHLNSSVRSIDLNSGKIITTIDLPNAEKIMDIQASFLSRKDQVLIQFRTVDIDGFLYTFNGPSVYSWKIKKSVLELVETNDREGMFLELGNLNLNSARNRITKAKTPMESVYSYIMSYDLERNITLVVKKTAIKPGVTLSGEVYAPANKSRKNALFRNDLVLPIITGQDSLENDPMTGAIKMEDLKLDLAQIKNGNNGGLKGLPVFEKAVNDSTTFYESKELDSSGQRFCYIIRNKPNGADSFYLNFDQVFPPYPNVKQFYWVQNDSLHVFDIEAFHPIPAASAGILFNYFNSNFLSLRHPYYEPGYAHLIENDYYSVGSREWMIRDIDLNNQLTWEYPYQAGIVDTVAVMDSVGEISHYAAQRREDFLQFKRPGDKFGKNIINKIRASEKGFSQVRYWKKDQHAILTKDGRLLIYNMALDSITGSLPCSKGDFNNLYRADSSLLLVSNKEKNETSFLDPEKNLSVTVSGYFNPDIRQRDDIIILQDASFGNYYLYSKKDQQFLCTVTLFSNRDFVAYTKEGLFDGTEKAMENIYFLVNDPLSKENPWKTIDLKQLKAKYYIPGMFQKLLNGDIADLPDVEAMKTVKLAPEIITDSSWSLKKPFHFIVEDKGGGIGPVRVVINGKEVIADARGIAKKEANRLIVSVDLLRYQAYFREQQNSIQVFAMNIDSSISSRGAITSSLEKSGSKAAPRLFMISIGTSDYKGTEIDLQYSSKDAIDMAEAMKMGGTKLFGADSIIIFTLSSNSKDSSLQPSKSNIQKVFQSVSLQSRAKDIVVVYLSGHGINAGNDFHYLTKDAWSANASTYAYKDLLNEVSVSSTEFTDFLNKIPALKQLVIIDACASGKLVENLIAHRDIPVSTLKALDRMKDRTGTHVITGCAADAVSYEASRFGQGLLTYSLLEGMKGASLRENRFLDVSQWFQYARDRVPQLANGLGGIQTPQICSPLNNESFDVAELDDKEKQQIPLAREKPVFIRSLFQEESNFADILGLGKTLDILLNETSEKGRESNYLYIPVDDFPGSFQVLGRYELNNQVINARIKIIASTGKKLISEFTISGNSVDKITTAIAEKINKFQ